MGLPDDIFQISLMMTHLTQKYLKKPDAGEGGQVNIYSGQAGVFITSVLKRKTLDISLSLEANISASEELIPCPEGKRILVLSGRISSAERVWMEIYNGDPSDTGSSLPEGDVLLLDKASLPVSNFVLPPTVVVLPHYMTSPGRGLWMKTVTRSASNEEERFVNGYLNYIYADA